MNNLIWFRNDLRIGDNSSLNDAVKGQKVIAFYCFETIFLIMIITDLNERASTGPSSYLKP